MADVIYKREINRIKTDDNTIREYETKKFLRRKPYFKKGEDIRCKNSVDYKITSNPTYKNFNHLYYHAGDLNNFERYGLLYLRTLKLNSYNKNIEYNIDRIDTFYKTFNLEDVKNTYHYMLNKFKKGIFVVIRDNKLLVFLPFSKANYINDFFPNLAVSKFDKNVLKDIQNLLNEINEYKQKRDKVPQHILDKYNKLQHIAYGNISQYLKRINYNRHKHVHKDRTKWVANNCMFKNMHPLPEGDQNVNVLEAYFVELLKTREIPDCCFFMNLRDHPIINKDLTEPYFHLFGQNKKIDDKFVFENYVPILSFSPHIKSADMSFITPDDIKRVLPEYVFPDKCDQFFQRQYSLSRTINDNDKKKDWVNKISKVIFRGKGTGCGLDEETNIRLKVHYMSEQYPDILDCGIVDKNGRLKKHEQSDLDYLKKKIDLKPFMNMEEQNKFKYHLVLDGHAAAYRLTGLFSMNVLVMIPKSIYKIWARYYLKPDVHYIELEEDLSDLIEKYHWCEKNQDKCFEIIKNGNEIFDKYFSNEAVFDHSQNRLRQISNLVSKDFIKNNFKLYKNNGNKVNILISSIYRDTPKGDRKKQYDMFIKAWPILLKQYSNDYGIDIMIAEQSEEYKFNRGALCNIILEYAKKSKKYTNVFIVDIDTLISSDGIEHLFKPINGFKQLALTGTRYTVSHDDNGFFGAFIGIGIDSIPKDFRYYPNQIFGWGIEDDILQIRASLEHINIEKVPENVSVLDLEDGYYEIKDKLENTVVTDHRWEKYIYYFDTYNEIKEELIYETIKENSYTIDDITIIHNIYKLYQDDKFEEKVKQYIDKKNYPNLKSRYKSIRHACRTSNCLIK